MKKLNLIPALVILTLMWSCNKNSNSVKPSTTTSTNSLVADSVIVYSGSYVPNPNIINPVATDGPLSTATFGGPMGMTMDAAGNLYVADYYSDDIRKITTTGMVSTISKGMDMPSYVALDASGNLYTTFVQLDKIMPNGSYDKVSSAAVIGLTADNNGTIYAAEQTQVMKLDPSTGNLVTYAGSMTSGSADGAIATASFTNIVSLAADKSGNIYVMDGNNIRIIDVAKGQVKTMMLDGSQSFSTPQGIAVDQWDNVYVANYGAGAAGYITKVTASGAMSNFAGNKQRPVNAASLSGQAQAASFEGPSGIFILPSGNILVSGYDNVIQEIVTHKQH